MTKDITISASLQNELNSLEDRVSKLEIQLKNNNKENKQKKPKKTKDPNAPIKNISNYLHFSKEFRPKIVKENPDLKSKDIMKKMAEEWNKIKEDPKKKKKYDDIAIKDKKRYDKEISEYKIIN
jgi:hypothetical protein